MTLISKNRSLFLAMSLFLAGCATESHKITAFDHVNAEIKQNNEGVVIKESKNLINSVEPVVYQSQGNANASKQPATFTVQKPTGSMFNANPYEPKRPRSVDKGNITLNFEGQDIRQVISSIMTNMLKLNYTISPAVQGQVSLQTSRPIANADLLPLLETMLKENGHVMLKDGDMYRIMPLANASQNARPRVGKIKTQKTGYQVRIVPLKYVSAVEMQKRLAPYVPAGGLLEVDTARNTVTIAGIGSELARMQTIIETFDVDWLRGKAVGLYRLKNVKVADVMPELQGIFGEGGNTPFAGMFQFIPMERNNSIMVITSQESYLYDAKRWLERLDVSNQGEAERLYVYRVQNGRAEHIAGVLSGIFSDGGDSSVPAFNDSENFRDVSVAPGLDLATTGAQNGASPEQVAIPKPRSSGGGTVITGATATISADEENNSLVIKATPSNYDLVLQALRQIDVPKLQVMVEVVIAEVRLVDNLRYGFKFWLQQRDRKVNQGVTFNGPGSASIGTVDKNGVLTPSNGSTGFNYTLANMAGKINAEISALATKNMAKFISTPYLFVVDNETASFNVGERISVDTGKTSNSGGNTTSSKQYINTGVRLDVTPRVNAGGVVRLDISQEVSQSIPDKETNGNPNITDRTIDSSVITRDGQTIVLGGLIQQQGDLQRSGVPFVSDLPFVGSLFRGTTDNSTRTELIILITPHVSRNSAQTLDISREFRAKMKGIDASQQINAVPVD